jgi:hypothetical protein
VSEQEYAQPLRRGSSSNDGTFSFSPASLKRNRFDPGVWTGQLVIVEDEFFDLKSSQCHR